jgi:predicted metalloendopeptidase
MQLVLAVMALSAVPAPNPPLKGVDLSGMDRSVAPGDDFFAYANGGWFQRTEIPADRSSFGVWDVLFDAARDHTIEIIQEAARSTEAKSDAKRIGDFYSSFMDEAGIEAKGATPLQPELAAIAAIGDKQQLARALGQSLRADVDALNSTNFSTPNLFGVWVVQALDDPTHYAPYLLQGGLGMPDREYYVSAKPEQVEVRKKYEAYLARLFTLAGQRDAAGKAKRVMTLETRIARASATRVESEDLKLVQAWQREAFAKQAPGLDWTALFEGAGLQDAPRLFVWHPKAFVGLSALVGSESLAVWKEWMTAHAIARHARFLSAPFVEADFEFYGKVLTGTPQLRERWKRGVDYTSQALGEAVGKLYVQKYFAGDAKAKAKAMVDAVVKAFGQRVDKLSWMSPQTKARAKEKIAALRVGVGYPDTWRDYAGLEIRPGDAYGNALRAERFEYQHALAKLSKPVDRDEWWMTPQTVNAVNLPLQNALNFPAAILQPPFFDPAADPAVNFGAMGAVIGHEISHSFDDSGSQFDAQGRFVNWWTEEDLGHFKAASEQLARQFDGYEPLPGLRLNGHQTLSENIADVAGLAAAYDAWKATTAATAKPAAPGALSGDQLFFVGFAQAWREKQREPVLRQQVITDGHAPAQFRSDTVRNLDAWYAAFEVKPGQRLALPEAERVRVW